MYVYPSHSQNAKKDPLPHAKKVAYMKKMFPRYKKNIKVSKSRNVFDIAVELYKKGHKAIVMVVGSDRVQEFANLLDTYNGVDGRHGFYGFDDIRVVSAGERDPDAEGVEGMSASKMRVLHKQTTMMNSNLVFQKVSRMVKNCSKMFVQIWKSKKNTTSHWKN